LPLIHRQQVTGQPGTRRSVSRKITKPSNVEHRTILVSTYYFNSICL